MDSFGGGGWLDWSTVSSQTSSDESGKQSRIHIATAMKD
jgi:hypothetical protein